MPTLVFVCLSWFYHLNEPFLSAQGLQMVNDGILRLQSFRRKCTDKCSSPLSAKFTDSRPRQSKADGVCCVSRSGKRRGGNLISAVLITNENREHRTATSACTDVIAQSCTVQQRLISSHLVTTFYSISLCSKNYLSRSMCQSLDVISVKFYLLYIT